MDPELSFISPDINLDQVRPLDIKRIIAFVNHFVMSTVQVLNSFASEAERRIFEMENRLGKLEIELQLLEAKLDSIPGIQNTLFQDSTAEVPKPIPTASSQAAEVKEDVSNIHVPKPDSAVETTAAASAAIAVSKENLEGAFASEKLKVRDDPRYAKYFKMLKLGVVEAAVKLKMLSEGFDPTVLNNPDAVSDAAPVSSRPSRKTKKTSTSDDGDSDSVDSYTDTD